MAQKKKTPSKTLSKKDLKKTKGGILIGLNQTALKLDGIKGEITAVEFLK